MTRRVRLTVLGRVQGVGYRAWTQDEARALDLSGFVRNRRDGSVEILAMGAEAAVAALIEACRRGPPSAIVTEVVVEDAPEATFMPRPFAHHPTL